jgi:4-amino-4-deoxy-L-arabinose transferase-like glycosyltransferase
MLATKWNRPLQLNDSIWYSYTATDLTQGIWFRNLLTGGPSAEHAPLTTIVITPASFLADPVLGQRITTTLLGITSVVLVAFVGRRVGGERVGLVAGLLAAVYPNMWLSDGLVMSESLAIVIVAGFLLLALELVETPTMRVGAAVGAVVALAALTRSELLLLGPLLAAVVWHRHGWRTTWRPLALAGGVGLLVLAPWMLFNASRFERSVLLTTNDGTTLLGANCDDVYGGSNMGGWSLFCVFDAPEVPGDDSVRSAAQRDLAFEYIGANIERVPLVMAARVARVVDLHGVPDMVNGDVGEERPRAGVWLGIVMLWALIPLSLLGLRRMRPVHAQVLLLPVVVVLAITIVFYGGHRLRAPAEPVLCVAAAMFLARGVAVRSTDGSGNSAGDALDAGLAEGAVVEPDRDVAVDAGHGRGRIERIRHVPPFAGA